MITVEQKEFFRTIVAKEELSHLYLISAKSTKTINKDLKEIFKIFNCIYEEDFQKFEDYSNVLYLDVQNEKIKKEQLEDIFTKAQLYNLQENNRLFVIIKNIENATIQGLNSILKSIEEPNSNITIILTTTKIHAILDTIKSRCSIITLKETSQEDLISLLKTEKMWNANSEVLVNLFDDLEDIKEYLVETKFKRILNLIGAFKDSLHNKDVVYAFFSKFIVKEELFEIKMLLKLFTFCIHASFKDFDFEFDLGQEIYKNSQKALRQHPNIIRAIDLIEVFLNNLSTEKNFALSKEVFLINLMRLYE